MEYLPHVLALLGVWVVAVVTPGPNFLAAVIVSLPPVARVYKRVQGWIDRLAGALFVFFGGKLLFSR